MIHQHTV